MNELVELGKVESLGTTKDRRYRIKPNFARLEKSKNGWYRYDEEV